MLVDIYVLIIVIISANKIHDNKEDLGLGRTKVLLNECQESL